MRAAVAGARAALGDKAGVPEVPDTFLPVPRGVERLSTQETAEAYGKAREASEQALRGWNAGVDPTTFAAPLRLAASLMAGEIAVWRARGSVAGRGLGRAEELAAFLMWAQERGGTGGFPFPAARGTSKARAMEAASKFLSKAERAGQLDRVVRNGWIVDDLGDGGLQFDNGECGVAMAALFDATKDGRYLASARKAADWARAQPLCPNWNYNSFSVELLASVYVATGDATYLDAAVQKARLGVIPGQLRDGPRAGRWLDPHNARPAYHYIMMRALIRLAGVLPENHPARAEVLQCLRLGLKARNAEMAEKGVMTRDKAIEALILAERTVGGDQAFLSETRTPEALQALCVLISDDVRKGKRPLSVAEWGMLVEYDRGQEK